MNWKFICHYEQLDLLPTFTISHGCETDDGGYTPNLIIFIGWLVFTLCLEFEINKE